MLPLASCTASFGSRHLSTIGFLFFFYVMAALSFSAADAQVCEHLSGLPDEQSRLDAYTYYGLLRTGWHTVWRPGGRRVEP